jgi:hypothetical protein
MEKPTVPEMVAALWKLDRAGQDVVDLEREVETPGGRPSASDAELACDDAQRRG